MGGATGLFQVAISKLSKLQRVGGREREGGRIGERQLLSTCSKTASSVWSLCQVFGVCEDQPQDSCYVIFFYMGYEISPNNPPYDNGSSQMLRVVGGKVT